MHLDPATRDLLALTLTPGLGPVLIARLISSMGSAAAALAAPLAALRTVKGIGDARARAIHSAMRSASAAAGAEIDAAARLGVRFVAHGSPGYPPLLAQIPDPPPILYVRGDLAAAGDSAPDRYPVAIVGSRRCTPYGIEQTERFAGHLAASGLTVVSGGARGIDTAAHRAALRAGGRTIAVLGCGLAHCYPEENRELFDTIAAGRGALLSELPLSVAPASENFPARNRIISGLSLGVLLVEAGLGSGALITAKAAVDDHGREVFAIPGRVDSPASRGSLDLLKSGAAGLVTEPADVIAALESPARHVHGDTHAARYHGDSSLFHTDQPDHPPPDQAPLALPLTPAQEQILAALESPLTLDELSIATGLDPSPLRVDLTILELRRAVVRTGSRLAIAPRVRSGNLS